MRRFRLGRIKRRPEGTVFVWIISPPLLQGLELAPRVLHAERYEAGSLGEAAESLQLLGRTAALGEPEAALDIMTGAAIRRCVQEAHRLPCQRVALSYGLA